MRSALRAMLVVCGIVLGLAPPALADGPGVGTPTVVTLGDSAISGEAGRWAGNTNSSPSRVDALGSTAYWDTQTGEAIRGCHRSKAAQAYIGGGVDGLNLACSGARTSTTGTGSGQTSSPGIDFYSDASGRKGQALMLQEYARTHNVKAVVVMIGANNYGFGAIVERCVTNWATSPSWWKNYCSDDSDMTSRFTAARQEQETTAVKDALLRVRDGDDRRGLQRRRSTRSSPRPTGRRSRAASGFRYGETGWTRQSVGGCGVWNRDADWAHDTVVPAMNGSVRNGAAQSGITNLVVLDLQNALDGRRLCETGVGVLEEVGDRELDERRRGRPDGVGLADPHRHDDLRPVPAPGGQPRQLLGPAGDAQLPAARLQRRRRPRRALRAGRERPQRARGAADGAAVADTLKRRSRSALRTTETLENAIARPASSGFSRPAAASGSAATL